MRSVARSSSTQRITVPICCSVLAAPFFFGRSVANCTVDTPTFSSDEKKRLSRTALLSHAKQSSASLAPVRWRCDSGPGRAGLRSVNKHTVKQATKRARCDEQALSRLGKPRYHVFKRLE